MRFLGFAFAAVTFFFMACSKSIPTPLHPGDRLWDVGVVTLVRSYQDRSERWTGHTVRVELPAGSYKVNGNELHWHCGRDTKPPTVVFECLTRLPVDSTQPLTVIGVCRGVVRDSTDRGAGINFTIYICEAVVTVTNLTRGGGAK